MHQIDSIELDLFLTAVLLAPRSHGWGEAASVQDPEGLFSFGLQFDKVAN